VTYEKAAAISLSPGDVTVHATGTAAATVNVTGDGTAQRTVTFTGISGNGNISYSIDADTAQDAAGNPTPAAGPSGEFAVDNTPPGIGIGLPSSTITRSGPVTYTVTYTDAETVSLAPGNISLVTTGDADGDVVVDGVGSEQRTVTIQNITGGGTIAIRVAAGTAEDAVGNPAPSAGPSTSFEVNDEAVSVSIGAPSVFVTKYGPVTYPVAYDNASSVSLSDEDVTVNTTGTATGTATVSGEGTTSRTVTVTSLGNGTLSISIAPGTALDVMSEPAPGAGPSSAFAVDNTPPTVAIGTPSVNLTRTGPVTFQVQYTGSSSVTLQATDVALNSTGTATADVAVSGDGLSTRTVTLSNIAGNGTLGISIASGTAVDGAGNLAFSAGPSATFTVDNTRPLVSIGSPAPQLTRSGPVAWTIEFGGADVVSLSPAHLTLTRTGTADAVAAISGSGSGSRTVTLYNATGDGTIALSVAADSARDGAGNAAAAVGPSAPAIIDNTPPVLTMMGEPMIEIEYTVPYADPGATAVDSVDGDITDRIVVANYVNTEIPGAYTVGYNVSDTAGNPAQTIVRTVQVVQTTFQQTMFELLGGTLCRPGFCVTINANRIFTPAGVIKVVIDRPSLSVFPPGLLESVVPGTWFDLRPNHIGAADLGTVTLYYDDADNDGTVDGTEFKEEELFVYLINPATGEVVILEGQVFAADNYVEVPITRFGVYALGCFTDSGDPPWDPDAPMPVSGKAALFTSVLLLVLAGCVVIRRVSPRHFCSKR
jgi:hypothetical protein